MKTTLSIRMMAILWLTFFYNTLHAQNYCTPPNYLSGPYTGITLVKAGTINQATSSSDGYMNYTSTAGTCTVAKGGTATIELTCYYEPDMVMMFSGYLNVRIWIDWNQDFDFNDPDELAVSHPLDCRMVTAANPHVSKTFTITIPATATLGTTRMRIYEDMMPADGHEEPNPCGYATGIGQHGEVEDYSVLVSNTTGIPNLNSNQRVVCYPNPTSDCIYISGMELHSEFVVSVYSVTGKNVRRFVVNNNNELHRIYLNDLTDGLYLLEIADTEGVIIRTQKLLKQAH